MAKLDIISISFHGKEYKAAFIPDVFTGGNRRLLIASHSLNLVLYNDDKGYVDDAAKEIDEQIYAFVDDKNFSLPLERFIDNAKECLD